MDELKSEVKQLSRELEKFENECSDKDITLEELDSYQGLKDNIQDIIQSVSDHCEQLDKIVQELLFI